MDKMDKMDIYAAIVVIILVIIVGFFFYAADDLQNDQANACQKLNQYAFVKKVMTVGDKTQLLCCDTITNFPQHTCGVVDLKTKQIVKPYQVVDVQVVEEWS